MNGKQIFWGGFVSQAGKVGLESDAFARAVGSTMISYRLGKANKTCKGESQLRGRMGKRLYLR